MGTVGKSSLPKGGHSWPSILLINICLKPAKKEVLGFRSGKLILHGAQMCVMAENKCPQAWESGNMDWEILEKILHVTRLRNMFDLLLGQRTFSPQLSGIPGIGTHKMFILFATKRRCKEMRMAWKHSPNPFNNSCVLPWAWWNPFGLRSEYENQ